MVTLPQVRVGMLRAAGWLLLAMTCLALVSGTGIGASSSTVVPYINVDQSISITDPTATNVAPAVTNGATWTPGAPDVLNLGELSGSEVASASLTWKVSTNSLGGYTVLLSNPGAAPVMQPGGASGIDDMGSTPAAIVTTTSAFGVAVGDAVGHAEGSTNYAANPWGTTGGGGTQGTLYRGVPVAGMQVAQRGAPVSSDPVTLNFAAVSAASDLPAMGVYSGTVRLTATAL